MLRLYNSLSRKIEEFKPLNPPFVKMYTCGPTVYQFAHIGNFRTYLTSDILVRVLRRRGYDVKFVMNITDVGHLTNDDIGGGDTGEDKMLKTALKEGKTAEEVAEFYTDAFITDYKALNYTAPDEMPKATGHIKEQIELIEKLQRKGFTYLTNDGVYFDTSKFPSYGKMSSLDQVKEGARVEVNTEKRNPRDFALWKFSYQKPPLAPPYQGEDDLSLPDKGGAGRVRLMQWESPWGLGFPGWHLECSAMAMRYLGERLDIHTGGVDHKEIHHAPKSPPEISHTQQKFL